MKRVPSVASFLRNQKGAVMPMVGFIIILLLALAAVAVDIGYIVVTKQQLQNAVDASALAAAPSLILEEPEKTAQVQTTAMDMAARHRAGNDASVVLVPGDDIVINGNRVTVYARKLRERDTGLPLFFARILGIRYADVAAKATAEVIPSASACCVKPWALPDRWDDTTPIMGYDKGKDAWQGNGEWNGEEFTDGNGNGLWDTGEAFVDGNVNGLYDSEHYDRALSQANQEGFIPENPPAGQVGQQFTLKLNSKGNRPAASYFNPVIIPWPPEYEEGLPNKGADRYRESIIRCNPTLVTANQNLDVMSEPGNMVGPTTQGTQAIIDKDPNAFWNEELNTVDHYGGGTLGESPRIVFLPVYDPRIWPGTGRTTIVITKVVAFFIEDVQNGVVTGRMAKAPVSCMESPKPGGDESFTYSFRLVE